MLDSSARRPPACAAIAPAKWSAAMLDRPVTAPFAPMSSAQSSSVSEPVKMSFLSTLGTSTVTRRRLVRSSELSLMPTMRSSASSSIMLCAVRA